MTGSSNRPNFLSNLSFLIDELLLGKLSETVAVSGKRRTSAFTSAGVNVTVRSAVRLSCDSRTLRYISHVSRHCCHHNRGPVSPRGLLSLALL